jgi:hypothetical protein
MAFEVVSCPLMHALIANMTDSLGTNCLMRREAKTESTDLLRTAFLLIVFINKFALNLNLSHQHVEQKKLAHHKFLSTI